jgi:hypothetical protein
MLDYIAITLLGVVAVQLVIIHFLRKQIEVLQDRTVPEPFRSSLSPIRHEESIFAPPRQSNKSKTSISPVTLPANFARDFEDLVGMSKRTRSETNYLWKQAGGPQAAAKSKLK